LIGEENIIYLDEIWESVLSSNTNNSCIVKNAINKVKEAAEQQIDPKKHENEIKGLMQKLGFSE